MNTENFNPFEYNKETWLDEIIKLQGELALRYNTFEPNKISDFDINTYQDQQIFKDFLQIRFIEELTEAMEDTENKNHFIEEMTDAFNFLITSYIISDYTEFLSWTEVDIKDDFSEILKKAMFWEIVQQVGSTCNLLKNRPWRMTQYLVDLYLFEKKYKELWEMFNGLCNCLEISQKDLWDNWSLKYQVNKFRLDTHY